MYYTHLLKHSDAGCSIMEESPIHTSQYLEQIVPEFFNCSIGDGYPHVLIVCSDSKDALWRDEEFQAKFHSKDNQKPELLSAGWNRDKRAKRLSVHIDKGLNSIPDAVNEVLKSVTSCYEGAINAFVVDLLGSLPDLLNNPDETIASYCHTTLVKVIDKARDEVGCKRTLFVRVILPKNCYDAFKGRHYPPFVEYVVLGQLQNPKEQELQAKIVALERKIQEKDDQITCLLQKKGQLESEFAHNKTVPESEVNRIITDYENIVAKLRRENDELRRENELLRSKLVEITAISSQENSRTKIKRNN